LPRPEQQPHPPLVLGGTVKRRFAALAARYADEVNTLGAPDDELRARRARLDHACAEAGRDPATLGFSVMTACFLGESDAEVHERVARFAAIRGDGTDPAALVAERRDRWLVGTVEQVAARIEALQELGVTRILLQHLNHSDDAMIGLMPALGR
jgi:alkanesulfonate monooxygenase SsuD/methylene tetrahydromethanopterin reductase-like flavin-dependent oxidoreductase (luciferase family)